MSGAGAATGRPRSSSTRTSTCWPRSARRTGPGRCSTPSRTPRSGRTPTSKTCARAEPARRLTQG
eukprot:8669974-Alexandrium_andersonii.AAC.1